jgi:hypothetical protein
VFGCSGGHGERLYFHFCLRQRIKSEKKRKALGDIGPVLNLRNWDMTVDWLGKEGKQSFEDKCASQGRRRTNPSDGGLELGNEGKAHKAPF